MTSDDQPRFFARLKPCFEVWGMKPSSSAEAIWFNALRAFTYADVDRGLNEFMAVTNKYARANVRPNDIARVIEEFTVKTAIVTKCRLCDERSMIPSVGLCEAHHNDALKDSGQLMMGYFKGTDWEGFYINNVLQDKGE